MLQMAQFTPKSLPRFWMPPKSVPWVLIKIPWASSHLTGNGDTTAKKMKERCQKFYGQICKKYMKSLLLTELLKNGKTAVVSFF